MKQYLSTAAALITAALGIQTASAESGAYWETTRSLFNDEPIVATRPVSRRVVVAPTAAYRSYRSYTSVPTRTRSRVIASRAIVAEPIGERVAVTRRSAVVARPATTIAFGGQQTTLVNPGWPYSRPYSGVVYRTSDFDTGFAAAPADVTRGWVRSRDYVWRNQRYHWQGGNWVVIGSSFGAPYTYPAPETTTGYYTTSRDATYLTPTDVVTTPVAYSTTATTATGSVGADVQSMLAREGYYFGSIDGVMGPQTRSAIAAYQSDHGLAITGRISESLLRSLGLS